MRPVRKLAVRISETVVERARPRCKEWAQGLAHEIEFVEGDWRALGWAIGSLRVLVRNPPTPLRNVAEIARAGRLFAGSREHTPPIICLLMVMQVISNGLHLVPPTGRVGPLGLAGFAIAALSAAYMAVLLWLDTRMSQRPEDMDDCAWIEFYRREMVRRRDLYTGFGALFPASMVLWCAGMVLGYGGMARLYVTSCLIAFCVFVTFVVSLSPRPAESFQRKVDEVDSILRHGGREA